MTIFVGEYYMTCNFLITSNYNYATSQYLDIIFWYFVFAFSLYCLMVKSSSKICIKFERSADH